MKLVQIPIASIAVFAIAILGFQTADSQQVKKSGSGICHCPGGQFYDRTTNFTPFENLEACLATGGREPQRGQGDCSAVSPTESPELDSPTEGGGAQRGPVKKSGSGICHCPGGQFYDRTTNFTAFNSLVGCLESGGREPQRGQGTCPVEPVSEPTAMRVVPRYDRAVFGAWADDDGDCQNTRHERLIGRSLDPVELSVDGCFVTQGRWYDPYTDTMFTAASSVEIDHVVPLAYAWSRGAAFWEPEKQRQFANDPANLLPVAAPANRSKGAAGPLQWLPPAEEFHCEYVLRFGRVIHRYAMELPVEEMESLHLLTNEKCD